MSVLDEVAAERRHQISKGYNRRHDDGHSFEEIAAAAAAYASASVYPPYGPPPGWPWEREAFQSEGPRANMIKALALGVAAIERLDRADRALRPNLRPRRGPGLTDLVQSGEITSPYFPDEDLDKEDLLEALWSDAENEVALLKQSVGFTDDLIAEAYHEHRREREPGLSPWTDVKPESACWWHARLFAARLSALAQTKTVEQSNGGKGE